MENFKSVLLDKKQEDYQSIIENLSKTNQDIILKDGEYRTYVISEVTSRTKISFSSLLYVLENEIEIDVDFQRDSNDHKNDVPQKIVVDYVSGQYMGNITLYDSPNERKKLVIDGRHRLTHLKNFINGELVLKGESAAKFWTLVLPEIYKLITEKRRTVELNKFLSDLINPKKIKSKNPKLNGKIKVKEVKYPELPASIKEFIKSKVEISVTDFKVEYHNHNHNDIGISNQLTRDDEMGAIMAWRKFYRMNNHSGKMTPDDNLWGMDSVYNEKSQLMTTFKSLRNIFGILDKNGTQDERKKLNEMLVSIMVFLDKKFPWGGSSNKLVKSISENPKMSYMGEESTKFFNFINYSLEPNFKRMISVGDSFSLSDNLKGIKSGNLTNIRQFTLFIYLLHKIVEEDKSFPLYNDTPTETMKSVLALGSKIITTCILNKDGVINSDNLENEGLMSIYKNNTELFNKIAEYRKNQRNYDTMISTYTDLVKICIEYTF